MYRAAGHTERPYPADPVHLLMRTVIALIFLVAAILVGFGEYIIHTGRSPDEAVGGTLPILFAMVLGVVGVILTIIHYLTD